MATAESGGGGAGGKFRKKPTRRPNSTPYDRPPTALRPSQVLAAPFNNNNNSWISKIVDPASRLITAGAHKLFSSVFRKRLLPPPQPQPQPQSSDEATEMRDAQQENTMVVSPSGSKEAIVSRGTNLRGVTDNGGVAELEDILKQKTFTRSEIDHLTALLMSRNVDGLVEAEKEKSETNFSCEKAIDGRHEMLTDLPSLENRVERAEISTPVVRSKVVDDVVASPADLAKAYMGSRPTRAYPSVLGPQNDMPREDLSASYNLFSKPKSSSMSLIQRPSVDIGASDNGFMTPRFRGRSAIYSMARTPYSRLHPAKVFKAVENSSDVCGASSASHNVSELQQLSGSNRQVLKRRSSVLESDIGAVGPIRRIRQKPNLLHQKTLSGPTSGSVHLKHGSERPPNDTEFPPSTNWSSHHRSSTKALADNGMPSTSIGYVPTKSVETAEKIFQHLDNLTPKGKSLEKKIDMLEGSSSEKRTSDVRDGLALKSRNNRGSLKILETSGGSRKENGLLDPKNAQDCLPKVSSCVEEVGLEKFPIPSVEGGSEKGRPNKGLDNMIEQTIFGKQQKKRVFQISAHEDYLELDDDVLINDAASTPTTKGENINNMAKNSGVISDNSSQNTVNSDANPPAPNVNSSVNLLAAKNESSLPDNFSASHKITGFASSFVPPSSSGTSMTSTQVAPSSPLVAEMDKAAAQNEKVNENNPNNSNTANLVPLSSSTSCSTLEPAVLTHMKTELLRSESSAVPKVNEPDKTDKKNPFLFADASKKIGDTPSMPSDAKGFFTFGTSSSSTTLSNGLSSSNGGLSPTKILSSSNDQTPNSVSLPVFSFSNGNALSTSTVASSVVPVNSTSLAGNTATTFGSGNVSQVSTSIAAPSISSKPTFQFGSSATVSMSAIVGTSTLEPTTKNEAEIKQNRFGNFNNIPLTTKALGTATSGSDNSEVPVASAFKTGGNETPIAATPAFPGGSIFGFQASSSSSANGAPLSTHALPSQSASSASSIFGLSVPTGFDASKVGNPFAPQVSISVSSTPGTSPVTTPISSSANSTTAGVFGWPASKPAAPFGTSSQSTGFAFGSTISGTSSAANNNSTTPVFGASPNTSSNNAPFVFGSTSSSVFSAPSAVGSNPAASTTAFSSQPTFGISTPQPFTFGSTPLGGNSDQMSMEDSMAEDSLQVPAPAVPVFGTPLSGPSSFVFGGGAPTPTPTPTQTPSMGNPFQFGGQQTQVGSQNTPFQPSGSFELNAGGAGSFSLGSGGVDKSNRRMVRVKNRIRKK